jgi:hypothetical protein
MPLASTNCVGAVWWVWLVMTKLLMFMENPSVAAISSRSCRR